MRRHSWIWLIALPLTITIAAIAKILPPDWGAWHPSNSADFTVNWIQIGASIWLLVGAVVVLVRRLRPPGAPGAGR